jgi:hypothetical protein
LISSGANGLNGAGTSGSWEIQELVVQAVHQEQMD